MTRFTIDNTEGYSVRDIAILNDRFDDAVRSQNNALDIISEGEIDSWKDHCAEKILAEYDLTAKPEPMSVETLIVARYEQITDPHAASRMGDWYRGSYQKRLTDGQGTCYFITITHSVIPNRPHDGDLFAPLVQFKRGDLTFNVQMLWHGESVEQMEAYFAEFWTAMRFDHYKKSGTEDNFK